MTITKIKANRISMSFDIIKASGKKEQFDIEKFRHSLEKAGADAKTIKDLLQEIQKRNITTTRDIYGFAFAALTKRNPSVAARYNLKHALFQLGPTGFPFEKFVSYIFKDQGYKNVKTDQILLGFCLNHELDITAEKEGKKHIVECKFHNTHGPKTDVTVTLYVKARFDDITKKSAEPKNSYIGWVITNTKFTSEAIRYAQCVNLKLLGWGYPIHKGLEEQIDALSLHPITALTSINTRQKKALIKKGFVLCRDATQYKHQMQEIGLKPQQIKEIIKEAQGVCSL